MIYQRELRIIRVEEIRRKNIIKKSPIKGPFINVVIEVRFVAVGSLVQALLETLEKECCSS